VLLVATFGLVGATAAPAFAASCDPVRILEACLTNNATTHMKITDYWCWAPNMWTLETEDFTCDGKSPREVAPFGDVWDDTDAFSVDANCITDGHGTWDGTPYSIHQDRRGKGSIWYRLHGNDYFIVDGKNCFPPSGLKVTGSNQSSISIAWNPIPGADYKVYVNGVYRSYLYGSSGITAYTAYNLNASTSYTFGVTMVRRSIETTKATITATSGSIPWQYNTARQLRNEGSGLCLVVQGSLDGSQAFMHDCSIPYADQLWTTRAGNGGGTEIANANSGMCLVSPYWFDYGVTQTYCDIYPDSKWEILDTGPAHRIKNVNLGECLVGSTEYAYNATMAPCGLATPAFYWTQR
jgi:hypothetical protein